MKRACIYIYMHACAHHVICMRVYDIYIYIHMRMYISLYIYTYITRTRGRQGKKEKHHKIQSSDITAPSPKRPNHTKTLTFGNLSLQQLPTTTYCDKTVDQGSVTHVISYISATDDRLSNDLPRLCKV